MEEDISKYKKPSVTVDVVVFTIENNDLKVLLVKRAINPFKDKWALPGGFVRIEESLEKAARRELEEETGVKGVYLEQLYTFGELNRDPRDRVITISYFALINSNKVNLKASSDVSEAKWFSVSKLPQLAFDHKKILNYSLKRLKWKFEYTPVAFSMLPEKFTLSELRDIYEIVFGKEFDKRNFRKKLFSLNILKEEEVKTGVSHRPPKLYSLKLDVGEIVEIL
jgi:8-oxo-dGTP diphosphatase